MKKKEEIRENMEGRVVKEWNEKKKKRKLGRIRKKELVREVE